MRIKRKEMVAGTPCRDCGVEFRSYVGKPGYVDQCGECAVDVPRVGGNMVWAHKTAPELEIKTMVEAVKFASKTRRFGAGVTSCIVQGKGGESDKVGTGAGAGDGYRSKLGERMTVKR